MHSKLKIVVSDNGKAYLLDYHEHRYHPVWDEIKEGVDWKPLKEFRDASHGGSVRIRRKEPLEFGFTPMIPRHNHPVHPEDGWKAREAYARIFGTNLGWRMSADLREMIEKLIKENEEVKDRWAAYNAGSGPLPERSEDLEKYLIEFLQGLDADGLIDTEDLEESETARYRHQENEGGQVFSEYMRFSVYDID